MNRLYTTLVLMGTLLPVHAQTTLSLDSCRAMALRNNKQLNVAKLQQDVARNMRKSLRTKYLPKIDAMGGYEFVSKEISLLNDQQKAGFANLGTNISNGLGANLSTMIGGLVQQGVLSPQMAQQLGSLMENLGAAISQAGNAIGNSINEALKTDTRQVWAGTVMVKQPIYMGGAIIAANNIADINEQMAANDLSQRTQTTLYDIDHAYWLVVSLRQKQKLANSYQELVKKLSSDVQKMIEQGVATRADGLKVDVKVNEADMQVTQAENGVALAKMLLCQLCGLPLEENIQLVDENAELLSPGVNSEANQAIDITTTRPELRLLQNAVDISKQNTRLIRAAYLPHVALTGGYFISNPNMFNGFQRKFSGAWNVGVIVQVPVWNWFEGAYKVRATKTATSIAELTMSDAQEKIELQIAQSRFKVKEANKKLAMAMKSVSSAEENLRSANLGFKEGVMESTDVMAAQTAWQKAQSQKIEAEVEVKLAQVNLNKALGILQ